MESKRFDVALLVWFLTAWIGGHKIYIEGKVHYILWYWALSTVTIGIAPLIGLFKMKGRIEEVNKLSQMN